jgi:LysM repeat protein
MFARGPLRRFLPAAAAAGALAAAPLAGLAPAAAERSPAAGTVGYVVAPGDTLWLIAERRYPDSDPRAAVWRIRQRNGLADPLLVPGQRLVLP